jgi:hypothetical protein
MRANLEPWKNAYGLLLMKGFLMKASISHSPVVVAVAFDLPGVVQPLVARVARGEREKGEERAVREFMGRVLDALRGVPF